jgi:hypothetical protein
MVLVNVHNIMPSIINDGEGITISSNTGQKSPQKTTGLSNPLAIRIKLYDNLPLLFEILRIFYPQTLFNYHYSLIYKQTITIR